MKHFFNLLLICVTANTTNAQDTVALISTNPYILGTTIEIQSNILAERRVLNIYLPAEYNDTINYPVIYLLDGSADEDFIHVAGVVQFLNFPWIQSVPNSIVVGIANVDRRRDLTFPTTIKKDKLDFPTTGQSAKFIDFIEKELQPFIERRYKTSESKTIIGQSLGGLLATEILFKKPALFTKYIIVSPSLWWDKESLLLLKPKALQQTFNKSISVFIANGKEGKIMEADTRKLVTTLRQGQKSNIKVYYEYFNNENHASILHNAVYKGLETLNKHKKQ